MLPLFDEHDREPALRELPPDNPAARAGPDHDDVALDVIPLRPVVGPVDLLEPSRLLKLRLLGTLPPECFEDARPVEVHEAVDERYEPERHSKDGVLLPPPDQRVLRCGG